MTSKGQVTVPKAVRDALGIKEGGQVVFRVEGNRAVIARTPDLLTLAGTIRVPAAKRNVAWDMDLVVVVSIVVMAVPSLHGRTRQLLLEPAFSDTRGLGSVAVSGCRSAPDRAIRTRVGPPSLSDDPPMHGNEFDVGDRVTVGDGYDGATSVWLQGGEGYSGTLIEIAGPVAVVELDDELVLSGDWQDFGGGAPEAIGTVSEARGRWLALLQGWVGGTWTNPTGRLHVGLCAKRPQPTAIPPGGGIGCWVESHAAMRAAA